ncbi:MAG: flagellar M-ring protein FliF [Candidatus Glassbacteria bacterium RIFCSPLOWO2_12_FULL_58_11]|uniref:Flagellar M-ring protein n=2 Tax=Candidatus Glassiibacteriota TaxID=1817805 RepID=A0A1F5YLX7_9BACT|nr:MAG: flagellar M-ring protein FliF [Candidatus Glassbacteria bacterium GWA2_58_10]OGG00977.1 MAG: flagellar M-ring protein FliF [Candidatus Glassbacteria bacterium RIFCSPLOWO2_12_FULL_58_11]
MNEFFQNFLTQAREIWGRLSPNQRFAMVGVTFITIVGMIAMLIWVQRPKYDVLFSGLDEDDSNNILVELKSNKIPYQVEQNGMVILIPSNDIPETRLTLAGKGLPRTAGVGYEIFDKVNLGVTDFVQKINYRRALEGELSRSIETIRNVDKARVHIVIPEERLFTEDQQKPSASVMLKLRPSTKLDEKQILGVTHLVASSIEGLQPENITIVDSYGNMLSSVQAVDPMVKLTAHQLELRERMEDYLTKKVQSLLNGVLGTGNSVVRISAELDFKKVDQTIRTFDPNNVVVRGEQREENVQSNDQEKSSTTGESTITNFEINETMEHVVQESGSIRRLTVAVFVNEPTAMVPPATGGDPVRQSNPRSQQELDNIRAIVQNSVGYDPLRGDQVAINQLSFDTSQVDQEKQALEQAERREFWYSVAQKVLLVISILIFVLFARSLLRSLKILPPKEAAEEGIETAVPIEEEISLEAQKRAQIQEQVLIFAKEKPANVAKLIKTWMVEEEAGD